MLLNYVLRSLLKRFRANLVTVLSIGLLVAGSSVGVAFYLGLRQEVVNATPLENILILGRGATGESGSRMSLDTVRKLTVLPGIKTEASAPLIARELLTAVGVSSDGSKERGSVPLRGIDEQSFVVHHAKILSGAAPKAGTLEIAVGQGLLERFPNLKVGTTLPLPGGTAVISGTFAGLPGSNHNDELWSPRAAVELHAKAKHISSVTVVADGAATVAGFLTKVSNSKDIEADAFSLRDFRASEAGLAKTVKIVLLMIVLLSVIGAVAIGTTMSAAVNSRLPELAVLVTVGFRRGRLGRLVILESTLLAVVGAVVGLASSFGVGALLAKFGEIKVDVMTSFLVPVIGMGLGLVVGLIGGVIPANTVRRIQIIKYMR